MQQIPLGVSSLYGSRLAYGCWRVAGTWNPAEVTAASRAAGQRAITAAYEAGYTVFDNADIYCGGEAERILGETLRSVSGMREKVVVVTKCGIRFPGSPRPDSPQRYDFSASHILQSCEGSLRRLGIETIDVYLLHRPDYLADPEEVAEAFTSLKRAGKVRFFGVSNFRPTLVTALQVACPMPLVVHQVEISLAKLDAFTDGTLDQCLIEKLTPMAWSPLAGGLLGSGARQLLPAQQGYKVERVLGVLDALARERGVTREAVALAWLLKHPARIQPIVGTVQPDRIRQAAAADQLELSREDWYRLLLAARGEPLP
ncbi:MAG TPA: aldo/keto reductase [Verrucomicrobiota bacterium]|nr:aldo/keto reductase [Verrucomicrobiota bacterium]